MISLAYVKWAALYIFVGVILPVFVVSCFYRLFWWEPDGRRLWSKFFARSRPGLDGWVKLHSPRRCIYYCAENAKNHDLVKRLFLESAAESSVVKRKILKRVLSRPSRGKLPIDVLATQWLDLVEQATCHLIYRREPLLAGAWAQTVTGKTSSCVLGIEGIYVSLGPWTRAAIGHELVHIAQEARDRTLRREWRKIPFGFKRCIREGWISAFGGRWQVAVLQLRRINILFREVIREIKNEAEAHRLFWLWPVTLGVGIIILMQITLGIWSHLWLIF